ncbi:hypothetical protein [Pseudomonas hunanensis]|uniref:hypothetical protein n=1 Tax=Pseudomonas hunanensis TaxID=1247546 RepID=UPI0030D83271
MRLDENLDPASFAKGIFDDILGSTAPRVRSLDGRDKPKSKGNTGLMNDITREEFNARLETIEVKMDARVEAISSKIDGFLAAQVERDKRMDESIASVRRDIDRLGSLKLNIWGAMATALTIGLAITALSVTFYQTGKSDSSTAAATPPAVSAPPSEPSKK